MKKNRLLFDVLLAAALLVLLITLAIANTIVCHGILNGFGEKAELVKSEVEAKALEDEFSKIGFYLSITVNRDVIAEAEYEIASLRAAYSEGDEVGVTAAKSRLQCAIGRLRRLCDIGIDGII